MTSGDYRAALGAAGLVVTAFEDLTAQVARTWTVCIRRSLARGIVDGAVRGYLVRGRHRVFLDQGGERRECGTLDGAARDARLVVPHQARRLA